MDREERCRPAQSFHGVALVFVLDLELFERLLNHRIVAMWVLKKTFKESSLQQVHIDTIEAIPDIRLDFFSSSVHVEELIFRFFLS